MKQTTLATAADQSFENYRKPTRRDEFLKTMEAIVPWSGLCDVIEPHYPKAGNGRPPIGLERMLRIHFIQHWFNLADLACEKALYDSVSLLSLYRHAPFLTAHAPVGYLCDLAASQHHLTDRQGKQGKNRGYTPIFPVKTTAFLPLLGVPWCP